ncbi:putative protein Fyv10/Macrophage erythroblast attacher [Helianthus annuus]|nr:putative protein Fyv10/Macrophage erythroblast attacher [Helianthus annuus]
MEPFQNGNSTVTTATTPSVTTTSLPSHHDGVRTSKLTQLTESLKLEHQFVRVPFEHYKKTIRANHRAVEKEISAVVSALPDTNHLSQDEAVLHLNSLVSRLQGLKRKGYIYLNAVFDWYCISRLENIWLNNVLSLATNQFSRVTFL